MDWLEFRHYISIVFLESLKTFLTIKMEKFEKNFFNDVLKKTFLTSWVYKTVFHVSFLHEKFVEPGEIL